MTKVFRVSYGDGSIWTVLALDDRDAMVVAQKERKKARREWRYPLTASEVTL